MTKIDRVEFDQIDEFTRSTDYLAECGRRKVKVTMPFGATWPMHTHPAIIISRTLVRTPLIYAVGMFPNELGVGEAPSSHQLVHSLSPQITPERKSFKARNIKNPTRILAERCPTVSFKPQFGETAWYEFSTHPAGDRVRVGWEVDQNADESDPARNSLIYVSYKYQRTPDEADIYRMPIIAMDRAWVFGNKG